MNYSFAIIGGGAWGTAISIALARESDHKVIIWVREKEVCEEINRFHKNSLYLPNVNLNKNIVATNNISEALAPIIFYVTPAQHFRRVINIHKQYLTNHCKSAIGGGSTKPSNLSVSTLHCPQLMRRSHT